MGENIRKKKKRGQTYMKNEVIYQRKQVSKKVPLLKCMKKGDEEQRAKTRQHGYLP
jgi:hypothetical protein